MTSDDLVDEVAQAIVLSDPSGELGWAVASFCARVAVQKIQELRLTVLFPDEERMAW